MAMFPDSGVPPSDAKNSLPDVNTAGCQELWYSTSRCQPRFDPAAANAMLAEQMNLIMRGEVQYQCLNLDNVQLAVRYLIQRAKEQHVLLTGGPFNYDGAMDPPATYINDVMTIVIVPNVNNQGAVNLTLNGLGPHPIQRNDGLPLQSKDLTQGMPALISFHQGRWTVVGLVASQVPLVIKGGIDVWIRTDGSDVTGDGSANAADKAYRTLRGAWTGVGSKYASTPMFQINFKLGIPGTYEGGAIGPFGSCTLTGDINNPTAYRFDSRAMYGNTWGALWIDGINSMIITGVTLLFDRPGPDWYNCLWCMGGSGVRLEQCRFEILADNGNGGVIIINNPSNFAIAKGSLQVIGNNRTVGYLIWSAGGSGGGASTAYAGEFGDYYFNDIVIGNVGFWANGLGTLKWQSASSRIYNTNVTGRQYLVQENSVINMDGQPVPGSVVGNEESGGRFIP